MEITFERMYNAYLECKRRKSKTPSALSFSVCLSENIQSLVDDINSRTYEVSPSSCFLIHSPTIREVFCATFRDRVVQHFFIQELNDIFEDELYENTASCRVGKGPDYLVFKTHDTIKNLTDNYQNDLYYLKIDLSGYFVSIDRVILNNIVKNLINTKYFGIYREELLYLSDKIFLNNPTENCIFKESQKHWSTIPDRKTLFKTENSKYGLAIGNLTSQSGSNLYMNKIDHYITEVIKVDFYARYVDDILIIDKDIEKLKEAQKYLKEELPKIHLKISKHKTKKGSVYNSIKFLGKTIKPYYIIMSKETIGRTIKNSEKVQDCETTISSLNSIVGYIKRYKCKNILISCLKAMPEFVFDKYYFDENKYKFVKKSAKK